MRTRSPSYLDDAHDGADIQQTGEKKEKADPDAKLLEHRGVTVSGRRPNSTEGRAGSIQYRSKHFCMAVSAKAVGGSCVSFPTVFDLLVIHTR